MHFKINIIYLYIFKIYFNLIYLYFKFNLLIRGNYFPVEPNIEYQKKAHKNIDNEDIPCLLVDIILNHF